MKYGLYLLINSKIIVIIFLLEIHAIFNKDSILPLDPRRGLTVEDNLAEN